MAAEPEPSITARADQPLIGVLASEHDADTVIYFTTEDEADLPGSDDAVQDALSLAGAWSDVPWEEIEAGLDRIRHESEPTPPIEL